MKLENAPQVNGFTLLELLVSISVLVLLAALLMLAIGSARARARQSACMSNVRQHGIALQAFVADHGEYPLAFLPHSEKEKYSDHRVSWMLSLFPEHADVRPVPRGEPPVFDCPAASKPSEFMDGLGYLEYGYNAGGLGGILVTPLLGLGGKGTAAWRENGVMVSRFPPPVRQSEVVNPSEMLAIGDGLLGWKGVIQDGVWTLSRGPDAQDFMGSTVRSHQRHKGKANVGFADGHVESLSLDFLFSDESDKALRIWNRDNQPHRERLKL
jgi:prepilin-type processing-associated H-X9-DG protein/prepilin-type N-terminal cleavage/methylation domain-containing protein